MNQEFDDARIPTRGGGGRGHVYNLFMMYLQRLKLNTYLKLPFS